MKVTPDLKNKILKALRQQRKTREQLAAACGKKPSWASKLLSDGATAMRNIDEDDAISIENWLGVELLGTAVRSGDSVLSESAVAIAKRIDADDRFRRLLELLDEIITPSGPVVRTAPYIPKNEMARYGQEIIRIVFANDGKPGKVTRLVLELLEQRD